MHTIGWGPDRTDEILVPVIRDMNRRETEGTQSNITAFFGGGTGAGAFAPRRREGGSKRLHSALQKIGERSHNKTDAIPRSLTQQTVSVRNDVYEKDENEYEPEETAPKKKKTRRQKGK